MSIMSYSINNIFSFAYTVTLERTFAMWYGSQDLDEIADTVLELLNELTETLNLPVYVTHLKLAVLLR